MIRGNAVLIDLKPEVKSLSDRLATLRGYL